ncbi:MAG: hypothetical protein WBF53_15510 [Litorimonas sp.]
MTADQILEIFNHGMTTKDTNELMGVATSLECFRSPTLSTPKIVTGEKAPEAFRKAISSMAKSRDSVAIEVDQKIGDDRNAVYLLNVKSGRNKSKRALTIGLRGSSLISFVETDAV